MSTKVKGSTLPPRLTRSEQRALNRARLVTAAREVIVERGYEAMQLDQVAARVGVTKGSVYSIFGSKLELLLAVIADSEAAVEFVHANLRAVLGTVEDQLASLVDDMVAYSKSEIVALELPFQLEIMAMSTRTPRLAELAHNYSQRATTHMSEAFTGRPTRAGAILTAAQAARLAVFAIALTRGTVQGAASFGTPIDRTVTLAALEAAATAITLAN